MKNSNEFTEIKRNDEHTRDGLIDRLVERAPELSPVATLGLGVAGFGAMFLAGTATPLNIGEVSAKRYHSNPIIPSPGTFSIWGFIYAGMGALLVYQALPSQHDNPRFKKARIWLASTPLVNAAWIGLTGFEHVFWADGVIETQRIASRALHRALEIGQPNMVGVERWLAIPISVYTGWLTVAEVLSAVNLAIDLGWSATTPSPKVWGPAVLSATAAGVALDVKRNRDPWIGVPTLIALIGIAKKHTRELNRNGQKAQENGADTLLKAATGLALVGAAWLAPKIVRWLRA